MTVRAAPASGRCTTRGRGVSPRFGAVYTVNSETVARVSARRVRLGEEHRRQLALERLHRRLQRDGAGAPGQLRLQLGSGLARLAEPPFLVPTR